MSKNSHIEMNENIFPEEENKLAEETETTDFLSREADGSVAVWAQEYEEGKKIVFINVDRTSVSMSEPEFFVLAKNVQAAVKKLLGIE